MNDEFRGRLSRALPPDLPAPRIDLDEVERRGERLLRRRRFGAVGVVTGGVAVLAAAALLLPTAFAGANGGHEAADQTGHQKAYPLPDLDPNALYGWIGSDDEEQTEATEALTEGYWAFLTEQFPDLAVLDRDLYFEGSEETSGSRVEYLDPADYPVLLRGENTLGIVKDEFKDDWPDMEGSDLMEPTDYTKPVYGLPPQEGLFETVQIRAEKDSEFFDALDISVHPKGSFAEGAEGIGEEPGYGPLLPYLAEGCQDGTNTAKNEPIEFDFECEEVDLPGGGSAHRITQTTGDGTKIWSRTNTVIVTLDNGNAVAVNDMVGGNRVDGTDTDFELTDVHPALSLDDLTALARSLPQVVVE